MEKKREVLLDIQGCNYATNSQQMDLDHLTVRDDTEACPIRNRGGEALALFLSKNPEIKVLDISKSNISDNGLAHICLTLRQSNQLEELHANPVGHTGLEFLLGVVQRCSRLRTFTLQVCDVPTLFAGRPNLSPSDYDTSDYVAPQPEAEDEGELEEEELQARAAKAEKLKKVFTENQYDSEDETIPEGDVKPVSRVLTKLLAELVASVRSQKNLTFVECIGDAVPNDVKLDIQRAAEEHQVLLQRLEREDKGARTGCDVLKDQMLEIQRMLDGKESSIGGNFPGEDLPTSMSIRSYIGRRLHSELGEALYECQRFKSKGNKALAQPQDEIAFIAMYLRKKMEEEQATT